MFPSFFTHLPVLGLHTYFRSFAFSLFGLHPNFLSATLSLGISFLSAIFVSISVGTSGTTCTSVTTASDLYEYAPFVLVNFCDEHAAKFGFCTSCGAFIGGTEDVFLTGQEGLCFDCFVSIKDELEGDERFHDGEPLHWTGADDEFLYDYTEGDVGQDGEI